MRPRGRRRVELVVGVCSSPRVRLLVSRETHCNASWNRNRAYVGSSKPRRRPRESKSLTLKVVDLSLSESQAKDAPSSRAILARWQTVAVRCPVSIGAFGSLRLSMQESQFSRCGRATCPSLPSSLVGLDPAVAQDRLARCDIDCGLGRVCLAHHEIPFVERSDQNGVLSRRHTTSIRERIATCPRDRFRSFQAAASSRATYSS